MEVTSDYLLRIIGMLQVKIITQEETIHKLQTVLEVSSVKKTDKKKVPLGK